jgi:hypothetical protein
MYYVKYLGTFGFIKPWTAVRDSETFSQQFLTPSIIEGIEKKLFPDLLENEIPGIKKIINHRLSYSGIDYQQEVTMSKGYKKEKNVLQKSRSIIKRGVLIYPKLYLLFENQTDAEIAYSQTICLARNEDLMFPIEIKKTECEDFDKIPGFELVFTEDNKGILVGVNRFNNKLMYGNLKVVGNPLSDEYEEY